MWRYKTKIGTFLIVHKDNQFHAIFEDEHLGSYTTPEQAAYELSMGYTFWPSVGIDPGTLGISGDLSDWEQLNS